MTIFILFSKSSEFDQIWQNYQVDSEENSFAFLSFFFFFYLAHQLRCDLEYILRKQPHSKAQLMWDTQGYVPGIAYIPRIASLREHVAITDNLVINLDSGPFLSLSAVFS